MIATAPPTFTRRLTDSERRAFARAIHGGLAAKVVRQAAGRYLVPSTSSSDVYAVWQDEAGMLHCPCIAGSLGRACTHKAAILLRRTQENAIRQARKMAKAPRPADPWTPAKREAQRARGIAAYARSKQWGADMPTTNAE